MKLPDKPSELINLALKDLEIIEKKPIYSIDMNTWHSYFNGNNSCAVCFAGSIMANTLKCKRTDCISPNDFDSDIVHKLYALNNFRAGYISMGLAELGYILHILDSNIFVPVEDYTFDPKQFKKDMRKIAKTFKGLGL